MKSRMNRPTWGGAALLLGLALLLTGCLSGGNGPTPAAPSPTSPPAGADAPAATLPPTQAPQILPTADLSGMLTGQTWVLVGMGDVNNPIVVEEGTLVTAIFGEDGTLSGSSGCNSYSGEYQLTGDQLSVGPLASTMMACESGMDQEARYLAALQKAQRASISPEGRLLVQYDENSQVDEALVFAPRAEPLTGPTWVLLSLGDPANPVAAEAGASVTAVFTDEGELSGSAGCNRYTTGYEITAEGGMSIGPAAVTMMFCSRGMEQEAAFLAALETAQSYALSGASLEIVYQGGVLRFTSQNQPLEHTLWQAVSMNGAPVSVNAPLTMLFVPGEQPGTGQVGGVVVCNQYSAAYTAGDGALAIETPATTRMACGPGLEESEAQYLSFLQTAANYEILGNQMTVSGEGGAAVFISADAPLEGTQWQLIALGARLSPVEPAPGSGFTALFTRTSGTPSGVVQGKAGCNQYNAVYAANESEIKINPPALTFMACEPDISEQETEFITALTQASSYIITGSMLYMPYGADKALVFAAQQPVVQNGIDLGPLNGGTWYLVSIADQPVLAGSQVTAAFAIDASSFTGQISGSAGCNEYSAVIAEQFSIQLPAQTMKMCAEPKGVMEQESAYLSALPQATGYALAGDQLVIHTRAGNLVYTATPPVGADQSALLAGRTWYLTAINSTAALAGDVPTAFFDPQGSLTGQGGCNTYNGSYTTDRDALKVSGLASTKKACPEEQMAQENAFLTSLQNAATFLVDGVRLTIFAADGSILYFSVSP